MTIQLSGYTPIFNSSIYLRDRPARSKMDLGDHILAIALYDKPTKDDIINYLLQNTLNVENSDSDDWMKFFERAQKLVNTLPDDIVTKLTVNDKQLIKIVRSLIPDQDKIDAREQYMQMTYCSLPKRLPKKMIEAQTYREALSYLINDGLNLVWSATIMLHNESLPEKSEMDILLKHGTYASKTLGIDGDVAPEELRENIGSLYKGLSSPENMNELQDVSETMIRQACLELLKELNKRYSPKTVLLFVDNAKKRCQPPTPSFPDSNRLH